MSGRFALIIGNTEYIDPGLAQLTAPGIDAEDFARVLRNQEICAFDHVNMILNQPSSAVIEAIDLFFDQKKPDDLLVLYFSGHGVRDELGALYLAVRNTNRARLRSTAIKSDYIREAMDQSRSKRQLLILDCYNSGAYAQGTKAATGVSIGTAAAFDGGYGRIILTANDSTQYAWTDDKVIGQTSVSLFTNFLVKGLEGEADVDGDGRITVDELYDYAYEKVRLAAPEQTPSKFSSKQQGEIILRQSTRMEDIKAVPLPEALLKSIENPFPDVRLGAVRHLAKMLDGKNLGLARSARETLERIVQQDDSRAVSQAALQALKTTQQAGPAVEGMVDEETAPVSDEQTTREAEQLAAKKTLDEESAAKAKLEAERLAAEANEAARKAQVERTRIEIDAAVQEQLARKKAPEVNLEHTQIEEVPAKRDPARVRLEHKAAKKAEVDHTIIEERRQEFTKKKSEEERIAKSNLNIAVPKSSGAAASMTTMPPLQNWSWVIAALLIAGAFGLVAMIGGYIWWRNSANASRPTPPPLVEATSSDLVFTDPTNTALSFPTNTIFPTDTPFQTEVVSPAPTIPPAPVTADFTATTNMYCYDGPGTDYDTHWEFYIGQTAEVLAKWSGDSNWLAIDINEPAETRTDCCWVESTKGTLNVSSDQIKSTSVIPDRMNCSAIK